MSSYTIGEAKTNLSKLIAAAERGEPVEIRRGKLPVVRLVPVPPADRPLRQPGAFKGEMKIADDFDTWPDDIAKALGIID
jgi:prevent-host-death family protein